MHSLSVNKLTKILYDGGMKAYLWFVVQTEFAKEIGAVSNNNELMLYNLTDEIEEKTDKFFTLDDVELKFICILAQNNSLYELSTKYGLPRRYCNNMLNKIKQKLK